MNLAKLIPGGIVFLILLALHGCSSDDGDDPDPSDPSGPGPGGGVQITSTSPEYTFWGDELTITGKGFSPVKEENVVTFVESSPGGIEGLKLTSDDGDVEIISASETKIVVRVPFSAEETNHTTLYRGLDISRIQVEVKGKKATSEHVKFIGLPWVGTFEYHYGWYDLSGVARSGDSVVISGGFFGSRLGGKEHPKEAGVYDKLRLSINGTNVPFKYRRITSSTDGFGIYLPAESFSEVNCEDGANGWNDRPMSFRFYVEGTDKENTRTLWVTYLPKYTVGSVEGPDKVYKSLGGNPYYTVTGKNMYFNKIRFLPVCEQLSVAEMEFENAGIIADEFQTAIPLSLLEHCDYRVRLVTPCGTSTEIALLSVLP